jgi:signal transduction histidine kinase
MNGRGADAARLAQIAHDLRTPLNAIRTWTQVLEMELAAAPANEAALRALRGIREGIDTQVRLIEEGLERGPFDETARRGGR